MKNKFHKLTGHRPHPVTGMLSYVLSKINDFFVLFFVKFSLGIIHIQIH